MLKHKRHRLIYWLSAALLALTWATTAFAQSTITYQYFYDDLGQLVKVVDSTGNVIEYVYDAVGNLLQIKRSTIASPLAIFNFTPQKGGIGATVTVQGQGFISTPSGNTVLFNGIAATVISATSTSLMVTVPVGATTGPIAVTAAGRTVTSDRDFTLLPLPVITSVLPKLTLPGSMISNFRVTGANLTGAAFSFTPMFSPPAITIGTVSIDPSGTSAVFDLIVAANAVGTFVLVATNSVGSSDAFPSATNTLKVLDPNAAYLPISAGVSVRNGNTFPSAPISAGVSVRNGNTFSSVPISAGVSVRNGNTVSSAPLGVSVSVTKGPNISAISPNSVSRGATVTVTISGANLSGATSVQFITNNGVLDSNLAASNLNVNANSTSLTATVAVNAGAALGRRLVVVSTSAGHSLAVDVGSNGIEIVQ